MIGKVPTQFSTISWSITPLLLILAYRASALEYMHTCSVNANKGKAVGSAILDEMAGENCHSVSTQDGKPGYHTIDTKCSVQVDAGAVQIG